MYKTKRSLKAFLCYASLDKPKARELYRMLRSQDIQPWLDVDDYVSGQNMEVEVSKALLSSDVILICLSRNSVDSEGFLQKEIRYVLNLAMEMPERRIFLIPVRLEECELPDSLRSYTAVDLFEIDGFSRLMRALALRESQISDVRMMASDVGNDPAELQPSVDGGESTEVKKGHELKEEPTLINLGIGGGVSGVVVAGTGNYINVSPQPAISEPARQNADNAPALKEGKMPRKLDTAVIVALIGLTGTVIAGLLGSPLLEKMFLSSPTASVTPSPLPSMTQFPLTATFTDEPTITQTFTITPSPLPSETFTPSPIPTEIVDGKGVSMVLIPSGVFTMGANSGPNNEIPAHSVQLDSYYIDKFEVTNAQYQLCVVDGTCIAPSKTFSNTRSNYYGNPQYADYPVIWVDWNMANQYCDWRGEETRLPTEAEWEKAARGTKERLYPWGDGIDCGYANLSGCVGDTASVGSYRSGKSIYGVYDMAGNVWEWVSDWLDERFYASVKATVDNTQGPSGGKLRVLRGGSFLSGQESLRTTMRYGGPNTYKAAGVGFRCARSLP